MAEENRQNHDVLEDVEENEAVETDIPVNQFDITGKFKQEKPQIR